jgi:hypothetical protein
MAGPEHESAASGVFGQPAGGGHRGGLGLCSRQRESPLRLEATFEKGFMRHDSRNIHPAPARQSDRRRLAGAGLCGLALALLLWAILGCSGLPDYQTHSSEISPRAKWIIVGTRGIEDAAKALDGDRGTAAVSGASYDKAHITIDLGKVCLFNMVVIDHGPNEYGFCGRVAVLTSLDNNAYTPRRSEPGTRRVSIVSLIKPELARYVRIRADAEGSRPWSLGEIYLE